MTEVLNGAPQQKVYQSLEQGKVVGVNKFCDIGGLLFEDCQSFSEKTEK